MNKDLSINASRNMTDILKNPGDLLTALVTDSGRKVLKVRTTEVSYSAVLYPSTGTIVETRITRLKG